MAIEKNFLAFLLTIIWLTPSHSFAVENQDNELQVHVPEGWHNFRDTNEPNVDKFINDSGQYQCKIARIRTGSPLSLDELMSFNMFVFRSIFPEVLITKLHVKVPDEEGSWCFSYIASQEPPYFLGIASFSVCNHTLAIVWETDEEDEYLLTHSQTFIKNIKCVAK